MSITRITGSKTVKQEASKPANKDWSFVQVKERDRIKPLKFYYDVEFGKGVLLVNQMDKIKENNRIFDIKLKREGSNPLDLAHSKRDVVCIVTFYFWQENQGWQYLISYNCDLEALQELKDLFKGEFAKEVETAYNMANLEALVNLIKKES